MAAYLKRQLASLLSGVSHALDLLSGAIDIIVVEYPDGSRRCTPFHVRFGRLKAFRSREKLVSIRINDSNIDDVFMKIGDRGEAYFMIEKIADSLEDVEGIPRDLVTSPPLLEVHLSKDLANQRSLSPQTLKILSDTRSGEEGDVSMYESLEDLLPSSRMTRNGRLPTTCSTNSLTSPDESFHNSPRDEMLSVDCDSLLDSDPRTEEEDGEVCSLELDAGISDSVLQRLTYELEHEYGDVQRIGLHHAASTDSFYSLLEDGSREEARELLESLDFLDDSDTEAEIEECIQHEMCLDGENSTRAEDPIEDDSIPTPSPAVEEKKTSRWDWLWGSFPTRLFGYGKRPNDATNTVVPSTSSVTDDSAPHRSSKKSRFRQILSYLWPFGRKVEAEILPTHDSVSSRTDEGISLPLTSNEQNTVSSNSVPSKPEISSPGSARFESSSSSTSVDRSSILTSLEQDMEEQPRSEASSTFSVPNSVVFSGETAPLSLSNNPSSSLPEKLSESPFAHQSNERIWIKDLRPSPEALRSLPLQPGMNKIGFSVHSRFQGRQEITARIFLWPSTAKIVISDIDGTITKSDALGHIMPLFGNDWSQPGIVKLLTQISSNGYQIVYLSARSIVQAGTTRNYLEMIRQNGSQLPDGPVLVSPAALFRALAREVIFRRPEEFKIPCLLDVRALFSRTYNPFYAGFGNKETDVKSYESVGVPKERTFTINSRGVVSSQHACYNSYSDLADLVATMFPNRFLGDSLRTPAPDAEYNDFNFWHLPMSSFSSSLSAETPSGNSENDEIVTSTKESSVPPLANRPVPIATIPLPVHFLGDDERKSFGL